MLQAPESRLAVLIDADNASAKTLKPIMDEVGGTGSHVWVKDKSAK